MLTAEALTEAQISRAGATAHGAGNAWLVVECDVAMSDEFAGRHDLPNRLRTMSRRVVAYAVRTGTERRADLWSSESWRASRRAENWS